MRPRVVWTILRKELVETLRDRRTLFAMLGIPLIVYPLFLIVGAQITAAAIARERALEPAIAIWGPVPEPVVRRLVDSLKARVVERRDAEPKDTALIAGELIRAEKIHLAIAAEPGAAERFSADGSASIRMFFSEAKRLSTASYERAADALEELSRETLEKRVTSRGLSEEFVAPLVLEKRDIATARERGGFFAARLLPYLLLLMVTLGAMYPAIDVTAGEKERGTMQTLLTAPVQAAEIVSGKYLTVVAVAMSSAALNLAGMRFALGRLGDMGSSAPRVSFSLGPDVYLKIFALLLPTAFLIAALLISITVFARSFREGQNLVSPLMVAVAFAGFLSFSTAKLSSALALVPLVNISMATRDLLSGEAAATPIFLVFLASTVYAVLAVTFAGRVFESEQVLLGGEKPWRDLLGRRLATSVPSGRSAVVFSLLLLVLFFYGSLFAAGRFGLAGVILLSQVFFLLIPALLWIKAGGHSLSQTLFLRAPGMRSLAGIVLVAAGAWAIGGLVNHIQTQLFPGAPSFFRQFERQLGAGLSSLSIVEGVALVALLPAIAEEVCFRGVVLSGLRSTGTAATSVAGSSLLFALFHVSPYRLLPAFALGILLGTVVLASRSLFGGVIVHVATNAVAVVALYFPESVKFMQTPIAIAGALIAVVAGIAILAGDHNRPREQAAPAA